MTTIDDRIERARAVGASAISITLEELAAPRETPNMIGDVAAFHRATDTPVLKRPNFVEYRARLRADLLDEEHDETQTALQSGDLVSLADGIADLIYVAIGIAHEFGLPLAEVWRRVHASNMAKVDPKTGKVRRRSDGKVLKPDGWIAPDVAGAIEDASTKAEVRT